MTNHGEQLFRLPSSHGHQSILLKVRPLSADTVRLDIEMEMPDNHDLGLNTSMCVVKFKSLKSSAVTRLIHRLANAFDEELLCLEPNLSISSGAVSLTLAKTGTNLVREHGKLELAMVLRPTGTERYEFCLMVDPSCLRDFDLASSSERLH